MKWISIKDRLPGLPGYYLACINGVVTEIGWDPDLSNKHNGWYFDEYNLRKDDKITHWMCMPEPPPEAE